jgi:hypothetical protein
MTLWIVVYLTALAGFKELSPLAGRLREFLRKDRNLEGLRSAAARVRLLAELLESGMVPGEEDWAPVRHFPRPWNRIIEESLLDLRKEGAPVLPTLERLHRTLLDQVDFTLEAKSKSAQALSQAHLSLALIPGFSLILYEFLPGVREAGGAFLLLSFFSTLLASFAYLWIVALADQARYGNMKPENRVWWVSIQATLERVFALISSGRPPDQAWSVAVGELHLSQPDLAVLWGARVWDPFTPQPGFSGCERTLVQLGVEIRRSIQVSMIEGRGCLDRLESIHRASSAEFQAGIRTALNLLPNRCLKPLFLFVLPGVMLLLTGSLWLSFKDAGFE